MNKGITITLIVLLSILVAVLIGLFVFLLNGKGFGFNWNFGVGYSTNLIDNKEIANVEDLKIDANTADIFVEYSDDEVTRIEVYSEDPGEHYINENDKKVEVKLLNKRNSFNFFTKQDKIVIKLPKDYDKYFNVNNRTGDIELPSFENLLLVVNGTTGDIRGNDLKELTANITTGDININNVKKSVINITTGDVKINDVSDLVVESRTGDITVNTITDHVAIKVTTGDIRINSANINVNSSITTTTGDIRIDTLTNAFIDASTKTGDNRVNNNDRTLENEIKLQTTTGDIRVN